MHYILKSNCIYSYSQGFHWLFKYTGGLVVSGLEVRAPFYVLPVSWQPVLKPHPQSAPVEKCLATRAHGPRTAAGFNALLTALSGM